MTLTIEEALHAITEKAAVLRFLSDSASGAPAAPDSAVLRGIGTICEDIEQLAGRVFATLSPSILDTRIGRIRRDPVPRKTP
jgi:hypothetical protein